MTILYGLKNCDTCRAARRWLDSKHIAYQFHDVRADGVDAALIRDWLAAVGADHLINRRSTTWRQLPESERAADPATLLVKYPTLIKRPVLAHEKTIDVGFSASDYAKLFAA